MMILTRMPSSRLCNLLVLAKELETPDLVWPCVLCVGVGCVCVWGVCANMFSSYLLRCKSEAATRRPMAAKLSKGEEAKLEAVLRRLCKGDRKGNYQVPEQVHKMWKRGGSHRRELRKVLLDCKGSKDSFAIASPNPK